MLAYIHPGKGVADISVWRGVDCLLRTWCLAIPRFNKQKVPCAFLFLNAYRWGAGGKKNKFIMKTIIAIYGSTGSGKSTSVLALESLLDREKVYEEHHNGDRLLIARHKSPLNGGEEAFVGCCSEGDPPGYQQNEWLEKCVEYKCEVIVAACRNSGHTVDNIERIARENGYTTVYTAPYGNEDEYEFLNRIFADNTLNLIDELIKR